MVGYGERVQVRDHFVLECADQAFIAEVPELPGCIADGATYQEAVTNAEVVIQ